MIRVTLKASPYADVVVIDGRDGNEEAVIAHCGNRIWPGPVDPKSEAQSEARYLVAKRMYAERMAKAK